MKTKQIVATLIICICTLYSTTLFAKTEGFAGTVVAVRGKVKLLRNKAKEKRIALKDEVFQGDIIKTGTRGRIQLSFKDDTIVSLGRNTEMQITEYMFKEDKSDGAMVINVKEGIFRVMGGIITKVAPDKFKTKTPTATIGIRGSMFAGRLRNNRLEAVFLGGRGIYVANEHGQVNIDKPSEWTVVDPDKKPRDPEPMPIEKMSKLLGDTGTGGTDAPRPPKDKKELDDKKEELKQEGEEREKALMEQIPDNGEQTEEYAQRKEEVEELLLEKFEDNTISTEAQESVWSWVASQATSAQLKGFSVGKTENGELFKNISSEDVYVDMNSDNEITTGEMDVSGEIQDLYAPPIGRGRTGTALAMPIKILEIDATQPTALSLDTYWAQGTGTMTEFDSSLFESEYSQWGVWALNYQDPNNSVNVETIEGLWVMGSKTAVANVQANLIGKDFVGHYSGGAVCNKNMTTDYVGSSLFNLDFRDSTWDGSMDFTEGDGPRIEMNGVLNANGFSGTTGTIGDSSADTFNTQGTYYGDTANGIGGTFDATQGSDSYIGAFAADATTGE